jgi:hypothetical protein
MTVNGYDLDPLAGLDATPEELDILANVMAEVGDWPPAYDGGDLPPGWDDEIDELANEYGLDPYMGEPVDLAAAYATEADSLAELGGMIDLAHATEATRLAEDQLPLPRRAEDRMAQLLARIERGTYTLPAYFRGARRPGQRGPGLRVR